MPKPGDGLTTDFALMSRAAAVTDTRAGEIRALLHTFITRMTSVPPSVWSGTAATTFKNVVDRWNTESVRLCAALDAIAETIRANERALQAATQQHAHDVAAAAGEL